MSVKIETSNQFNSFSSSALKKSYRDVLRLLKLNTLAADIRLEQERKLKAIELALEEKKLTQNEKSHMQRYRMIRFFERKKSLRHLETFLKKFEESQSSWTNEESKQIKMNLENLFKDLNYVYYYPKSMNYISLFPSQGVEAKDSFSEQKKIILRGEIFDKVISGELENALFTLKPEWHDFFSSSEIGSNLYNLLGVSKPSLKDEKANFISTRGGKKESEEEDEEVDDEDEDEDDDDEEFDEEEEDDEPSNNPSSGNKNNRKDDEEEEEDDDDEEEEEEEEDDDDDDDEDDEDDDEDDDEEEDEDDDEDDEDDDEEDEEEEEDDDSEVEDVRTQPKKQRR